MPFIKRGYYCLCRVMEIAPLRQCLVPESWFLRNVDSLTLQAWGLRTGTRERLILSHTAMIVVGWTGRHVSSRFAGRKRGVCRYLLNFPSEMRSFLRSKRATNLFQKVTLGSSFPVSKTANGDRMVINANLRAKIFKCLWHRAPAKLLSLLLFWRTEHLHFQCLLSVSLFGYYCTPTVLPTRPNGPLCPRGV